MNTSASSAQPKFGVSAGLAEGIGAAPSRIAPTIPRSSARAKPAATPNCVVVFAEMSLRGSRSCLNSKFELQR